MKKKRIKELIAKNQMNLTLAVISLVAFIIGCFGVGFLKSFIIVGVIDILLSLPTIIDLYQRKKKGGTNMAKKKTTTNHTTTRKKKITPTSKKVTKKDILEEKTVPLSNKPIVAPTKKKKQKKKGKLKRFLKWFLIGCFIIGTIILIIAGIFLFQVIKDAPEFDPNRLDRQESTILYFDNGEIITKIGAQKEKRLHMIKCLKY